MRALVIGCALVAVAGASATAQAPRPAAGRGAPGAEMFLARTGELGLTDAQVTRLAAIARRSAARRQATRASFDSIRTRFGPDNRPDSAARRQLAQRMRADMERIREQEHADRRDAIAVLTADQQARAWEMRGGANRARAGMRAQGMRGQVRGDRRPMAGRPSPDGMRPRPGMGVQPMQPRRPAPPAE